MKQGNASIKSEISVHSKKSSLKDKNPPAPSSQEMRKSSESESKKAQVQVLSIPEPNQSEVRVSKETL